MAPPKRFLPIIFLLLLLFSASDAPDPPRTLQIPVVHRSAVFPTPPGSLLSRLAADAARYTALTPLSSTAHAPVISGLPFNSGEYFALVGVGTPPVGALLVIDTGSDLVWLQCKPCRRCYHQTSPLFDPTLSSTYRKIPCSSPRCHVLRYPGCDGNTGSCGYIIVYGDGSASAGDLATDTLVFSEDAHVSNVTLGCGHDDEGPFESAAAGLLGVARGTLSFPTQVAAEYGRVFAYCLGGRASAARGGSYLVFGRTPDPPSTAFTPLLSNPRHPSMYYVDMAGFSVDGERVAGFSNASLALDPATGRGGVVVDSGTTVSRFAGDSYAALRDAFDARAAAAGMRRVVGRSSPVFDACYDLDGGAAAARAPRIVLHFAGGADVALPPRNYLVPVDGGRRRTYYCLGFEAADDGLSVLGNVQQQGFRVVFDVEKDRVGFAPNGCPV